MAGTVGRRRWCLVAKLLLLLVFTFFYNDFSYEWSCFFYFPVDFFLSFFLFCFDWGIGGSWIELRVCPCGVAFFLLLSPDSRLIYKLWGGMERWD
jgi:hypothetical protein